ncbi:hypothetical protein FJY90_01425 [Candidatus Gottesmanbacteria bacterium]|nr:hypothetical protein [Candidatus Gottesmanbacteria bacterium]
MRKIDLLVISFIIIASIFTLRDLFKPGFYTSHDGIHQVPRLYYFDQAIRDGQIPPRWAGGLLNGFGYPLFIFSYHFPWFIGETLHLSGLSIIESIKMTFLIGYVLSGITVYFFQKALFGRLAAFTGTIVYLFAPYRFSNIFVRAAIGDATAFIFPPMLFMAAYKIKQEKKSLKWILLGALALAGLLLSHAMVFLLFFFAFLLYSVLSLLLIESKWDFTKKIFLLIFLGLGLASYYLIPSIMEKSFTVFHSVLANVYMGNAFVSIKELLYSPWGYGLMHAEEGGMSFQVGIAQWLAFILSFIILVGYLLIKKNNKKKDQLVFEGMIFFILFIFSLIMMLPISLPVWKYVGNFMVIDFPWRILSLTIFSASVLSSFMVSRMRWPYLAIIIIIFLAFYGNRNHLRINKSLDWPLSFYLKLEKTTNSFDEYSPNWVRRELIKENTPKAQFFPEVAQIQIIENKSNSLKLLINSSSSGILRVNTVYYPGWEMAVDKVGTKIDYSNGLIEAKISQGARRIDLQFKETTTRKIADILSLVSLLIVVLGLYRSIRYA